MHPRNPYASPLDFSQLAKSYPALKPCLIPTSHGDFTISYRDARSQMLLTQALLNRDFGLSVRLLEDRLCPPIPNRLNYVLWIQDIVEASSLSDQVSQRGREIRGIDIGTGACAIYPLLACSLEQSWRFCATEIDQHSLDNAKAVVADNGLVSRIEILQAKEDGPLLLPLKLYNFDFDFSMCNPPFYSSREEMASSARAKESRPNAVCTGAEVEMITPGGEAAFVNRMIEESWALRTRCRWYTSMLGRMASLFAVCEALRAHSIDNYAITEFVQGQTRRWAVAWSFGDARLPDSIARISNPDLRSLMPPRNNLQQPFPAGSSLTIEIVERTLREVLQSILGVSVLAPQPSLRPLSPGQAAASSSDATVPRVLVTATQNTWSRSERRKIRQTAGYVRPQQLAVADPPALTCLIEWSATQMECQWICGRDRTLFESFWSHISRKVVQAVSMTT